MIFNLELGSKIQLKLLEHSLNKIYRQRRSINIPILVMDLKAQTKPDEDFNSITSTNPKAAVSNSSVFCDSESKSDPSDEKVIDLEKSITQESNISNSKEEGKPIIITDSTVTFANDTVSTSSTDVEQKLVWTKYFDSNTAKFYYHNAKTNVTQWEIPTDSIIDTSFLAPVSSSSLPIDSHAPSSSSYTMIASFATTNGSFASVGTGSYWDKVGRPNDRAGRQMAVFFDVNELERNREEARDKKTRLQQSGIDWRVYKEQKQQEKKKRRSEWLRDD